MSNTGYLSVKQLLVTNNVSGGATNSFFTFAGGTLTTSNAANAVASDLRPVVGSTQALNGVWYMLGGSNLVNATGAASVAVGNGASNAAVFVQNGALWNLGNNNLFVGLGQSTGNVLTVNGGTLTNGAITVGGAGSGFNTMSVTNANLWTSGLTIGNGSSNNTLSVLNSTWNLGNNNLFVGLGQSTGNVLTVNGGTLTNGAITVGGAGSGFNTMSVTNANLWTSGLTIGSGSSNNTLSVLNSTWNLGGSSVTIGSGAANANVLNVNSATLTNGTVIVGGTGSLGSQFNLNGGTTTVSSVTINSGHTFNFNGGTLGAVTGGTSISGSGVVSIAAGKQAIVDTLGNTATISSAITGSGDLLKTGAGTLNLSTNSTYSGSTFITAGTLKLLTLYTPGTFAPTNGNFETPNIGTGNGAYQYKPAGASWLMSGGAGIAGNGSAFNNGTAPEGTQVGLVQKTASFSNTITFAASGNYNLSFYSAYRNANAGVNNLNIYLDGTLLTNNFIPTSYAGQGVGIGGYLSYTTTVFNVTAGTHMFYIQGLNMGGDPSSVDRTSFLDLLMFNGLLTGGAGTNLLPVSTPVLLAGGAAFDLGGAQQTIASLADYGGSGGIVTNSGASTSTLTISSNDTTYSSSFSGAIVSGVSTISLVKAGASTLILAGANTYSGGTTLSGGELVVAAQTNLPTTGVLTFNGGMLGVSGTGFTNLNAYTINSGSFNGGFDISNSAAVFMVTNAIAGTGSLIKAGAGQLLLTGTNTLSGSTIINGGQIVLGQGAVLTNSTITVNSGGTLGFTNGYAVFTIGGLTGAGNVGLTNTAGSAITLAVGNNGASTVYSGILSGSGALTKIGAGTLTLAGAQTYTGATTVSNGTLLVNGSLANASLVTVATNGTLTGNATFGNVTISGGAHPVQRGLFQQFGGGVHLEQQRGGPDRRRSQCQREHADDQSAAGVGREQSGVQYPSRYCGDQRRDQRDERLVWLDQGRRGHVVSRRPEYL